MTLTNPSDHPVRVTFSPAPIEPAKRPSAPAATTDVVHLRSELRRQPEIRPEVVARAKALAADPNYPPMEVLRAVAQQILAAPDLSEDES
jgi:hypothetical protein